MSSPVRDDADTRIISALPWVSGAPRQDEMRRLQEEIIDAAQRFERESSGPPQQRTDVSFHLAEENRLDEMTARVFAAIKPEIMPPPPRRELRLPGLGLVAGFVGAVGLAAGIALIVASVVRIPTIDAAFSNGDE